MCNFDDDVVTLSNLKHPFGNGVFFLIKKNKNKCWLGRRLSTCLIFRSMSISSKALDNIKLTSVPEKKLTKYARALPCIKYSRQKRFASQSLPLKMA
jgi:hypothetical protein